MDFVTRKTAVYVNFLLSLFVVVTPKVTLVETSNVVVISYAWVHRAPKGIEPLAYNGGHQQLKRPNFVDN